MKASMILNKKRKIVSSNFLLGFDDSRFENRINGVRLCEECIDAVAHMSIALTNNTIGALGVDANGNVVAEYACVPPTKFKVDPSRDFSETDRIVVKITPDGVVRGAIIDTTGTYRSYVIEQTGTAKPGTITGAAAVMAAFLKFCLSHALAEVQAVTRTSIGSVERAEAVLTFSENVRKMLEGQELGIALPAITMLKSDDVCPIVKTVLGKFIAAERPKTSRADAVAINKARATTSDFQKRLALAGKYNPNPNRVLTDEEKELVYQLVESDDIPERAMYVSELIQKSHDTTPLWKFLMAAESSTGKSHFCDIVSFLTGLPIVRFECAPDTDKAALTMDLIPVGSSGNNNEKDNVTLESFMSSLPLADDWVFSPATSYKAITGVDFPDATAVNCQVAAMTQWGKIAESHSNGFRYVLSSLMQGLKNGWIVEIQEVLLLRMPGVMASLNAMFDDSAKIRLMDGSYIKRHKDAVVFITTNADYEGCGEMNQSVLSRFYNISLPMPEDDILVNRLMAKSGMKDEKLVKRMFAVWHSCLDLARDKGITDGAIDFRALNDWAVATLINGRVYDNGYEALISKCTFKYQEEKPEFEHCLQSQFMPGEMWNG